MEQKNDIEKIYYKEQHIASIIRPLLSKDGLSFLTEDENYIQVGIMELQKKFKTTCTFS